ncbi:TPA: site-specific DNA-methyltransferase [Candidatus Woesearchaeota archaeon]|nr:site-specific DNA-methyltransferase [Candidatus Woesearchaeota archaeon]
MTIKQSWFVMPYKLKKIRFNGESGFRYPEEFAEKFIKEFTQKGDKILDPFAGFGTTLLAAQKLGRIGVGIEYDQSRCEYIQERIKSPSQIIHGDSLKIADYNLPRFDFSLTSPPYMQSSDKENPLSNYTKPGVYAQYLKDLRKIYSQIKKIMKKNATIVIEVSNTFRAGHPMTPLAFDVARKISKILYFERELIYCVKDGKLKPGIANHSYCLIFKNK